MGKSINRVTFEQIEDGIVTSGKIASAKKWADAYCQSIDMWQRDSVVAAILTTEMEHIFDMCYKKPEGLVPHELKIAAIKQLLATMGELAVDPAKMEQLAKYEASIRSGVYEDDEDDEDEQSTDHRR
jgi:hypothetical protein